MSVESGEVEVQGKRCIVHRVSCIVYRACNLQDPNYPGESLITINQKEIKSKIKNQKKNLSKPCSKGISTRPPSDQIGITESA